MKLLPFVAWLLSLLRCLLWRGTVLNRHYIEVASKLNGQWRRTRR